MNWVLIAIISGLISTAPFKDEEACLGKKAMLEKDKITAVKCIEVPHENVFYSTGTIIIPH